MKRLTKRHALELCRDLWRWLARHPKAEKEGWPRWKWNGGDLPDFNCNCPCCEYVERLYFPGTNCKECPLVDFWPDKYCLTTGSAFERWERSSNPKARTKYATQIADAAVKELKKLTTKDALRRTS